MSGCITRGQTSRATERAGSEAMIAARSSLVLAVSCPWAHAQLFVRSGSSSPGLAGPAMRSTA